jgi:hypothetical protein
MNHPVIRSVLAAIKDGRNLQISVTDALNAALAQSATPREKQAALAKLESAVDSGMFPARSIKVVAEIMLQVRTMQDRLFAQ